MRVGDRLRRRCRRVSAGAGTAADVPRAHPLPSKRPPGWIAIEKVSDGCGQEGSPFRAHDQRYENDDGETITVDFNEACNLHDAAYSGAYVWDSINGRFVDFSKPFWTKKRSTRSSRRICRGSASGSSRGWAVGERSSPVPDLERRPQGGDVGRPELLRHRQQLFRSKPQGADQHLRSVEEHCARISTLRPCGRPLDDHAERRTPGPNGSSCPGRVGPRDGGGPRHVHGHVHHRRQPG